MLNRTMQLHMMTQGLTKQKKVSIKFRLAPKQGSRFLVLCFSTFPGKKMKKTAIDNVDSRTGLFKPSVAQYPQNKESTFKFKLKA